MRSHRALIRAGAVQQSHVGCGVSSKGRPGSSARAVSPCYLGVGLRDWRFVRLGVLLSHLEGRNFLSFPLFLDGRRNHCSPFYGLEEYSLGVPPGADLSMNMVSLPETLVFTQQKDAVTLLSVVNLLSLSHYPSSPLTPQVPKHRVNIPTP